MVFQEDFSFDTFFALLRSGMYDTPIPEADMPDTIDWKPIIVMAQKHAVLGILIESIKFLPERLRPSASTSAKLSKYALGLIKTNQVLDNRASELVSFLKQHGITGVLLKGRGVAYSYYKIPQTRQSCDIDLYVGKESYQKAADLCREHLADDKDACYETDRHFNFHFGGVEIELHFLSALIYNPLWNRRYQKWSVGQLEHSPSRRAIPVGNADITLPSYDFDAIFIFYHAWYHFITGGIGLRHLCDWAMILHSHSENIDTASLIRNLKRFGMTSGWKTFGCIAVRHLGVAEDKVPLFDPSYSKKAEKVFAQILEGGNFGFFSEEYIGSPNKHDLQRGITVLRKITKDFIRNFPIIPVESTFLYLDGLSRGVKTYLLGKGSITRCE